MICTLYNRKLQCFDKSSDYDAAFCCLASSDCKMQGGEVAEYAAKYPELQKACMSFIENTNAYNSTGFTYPVDVVFENGADGIIFVMFTKRFWNQDISDIGKYEYLSRIEGALKDIIDMLEAMPIPCIKLPDFMEETHGAYETEIRDIIETMFANTDYEIRFTGKDEE